MKTIYLLFLLVCSKLLTAQTGDGGGLQIMNITVPDYFWGMVTLSPSDTALKVNYYILSDDSIHKRVNQYHLNKKSFYLFDNRRRDAIIYIPPYTKSKGKISFILNQQLEIIYKKDTMLLDLINLRDWDANGTTDIIEKLNFSAGHYLKCYRDIRKKIPSLFTKGINGLLTVIPGKEKQTDSIQNALEKGINEETYPLLYKYGLLEEAPMLKRYIVVGKSENDTIYAAGFPVYYLSLEQVEYKILNGREIININTPDKPVLMDDKLYYKFFLTYHFNPQFLVRSVDPFGDKDSAARHFFSKLDTLPLYINNEMFSGVLKVGFNSYWYNITLKAYPTYGLIVHSYKNSLIASRSVMNDIDLFSERSLARPN